MASREEVEEIKALFDKMHPMPFFKKMSETNAGVGAVMRLINENDGAITAGQISDFMRVSTARVAALLKKMESRNLIVRERGSGDARVTVVKFTEHGREISDRIRQDFCYQIEKLIDELGTQRIKDFIETAEEIKNIMTGPPEEIIGGENAEII